MLSRPLRAALAAVALAAALPAVADAAAYRLVYEGDVEYRHVRETEEGTAKMVDVASFSVTGKLGGVEVREGRLLGSYAIPNLRAWGARASRTDTVEEGNQKTCRGSSAFSTTPAMLFPAAAVYGWPANTAALLPFYSVKLDMVCDNSEGGVSEEAITISNASPQRRRAAPSRFHLRLRMPTRSEEAIGRDGFEWDLRQVDTSLKSCPDRDYYTRYCRTSFVGRARLLPAR